MIHVGDCIEVMRALEANSFDSIVTDPPYHLTATKGGGPHGKGLATPYARAKAGATPGGFMGQAWDGGDIAQRPEVWAECLRLAKPGAHLVAFSGTRTSHRMVCAIEDAGWEIRDGLAWLYGQGFPKSHNGEWGGTALKPAWEPITLARKPLAGTVEANWREHGTGALNIDGCRIPAEAMADNTGAGGLPRRQVEEQRGPGTVTQPHEGGRWPANVVHDGSEGVIAAFPSEAGAQAPVFKRNGDKFKNSYGAFAGDVDEAGSTFQGDSGSAARFFYCAKASPADRGASNSHPTVKPTDLMRWLCRLVTPPGGLILDPFTGSGSTGKAALAEGFQFQGIELNPDYAAIANERIHHTPQGFSFA